MKKVKLILEITSYFDLFNAKEIFDLLRSNGYDFSHYVQLVDDEENIEEEAKEVKEE